MEEIILKARKRERRFQSFLRASFIFHGLALVVFFITFLLGGSDFGIGVGAVFFGIGALFSGMAGINADHFWGVTESVIYSKEMREELLKMCSELE